MAIRTKLDPLDEADDALSEMKRLGGEEGEESDEITGQTHVNVHFAAPPIVSQPQVEVSQPTPGVLNIAFTAVKQLNGWSLAAVLIVGIVAYTFLRWAGAVK